MIKNSQIAKLAVAGLVALLSYIFATFFLDEIHARLIAVVLFLVVMWTNEALPLGVVSLLPIVIFPALGLLDTNQTASNYANGIIFLFLGGFMMAIAVEKTELHKVIARRLLSIFPATPKGAIIALISASSLLGTVLSNTTTALLLLPLVHFLAKDTALKMRLALAVAFGSSIGGLITPIGTPPNLILLGFMQTNGITPPSFVGWIAITFPLALLMLSFLYTLLSAGASKLELGYQVSEFTPMTKVQKKLSLVLLSLGALLFFNSPIKPIYSGLGLDERSLILFFGLLMFLPGFRFLEWEDSKKIPYEIIFLFGAGFALASSFGATGFDQLVASTIGGVAGLHPFLTIMAVVIFIASLGIFISNTALASMSLPIIYSLAVENSLNVELFLFIATVSASFAFILPISTPPNAIAFSSKAVKVKDMAFYGVILTLAGSILTATIAMLYWQFVL